MSARHRGRRHGGGNGVAVTPNGGGGATAPTVEVVDVAPVSGVVPEIVPSGNGANGAGGASGAGRAIRPSRPPRVRVQATPAVAAPAATAIVPATAIAPAALTAAPADELGERKPACTLAQMRRFIKSRPYIPVHELRRHFLIEGCEDDVSPVAAGKGTVYVGLPAEEAQILGDLINSGEVGCEMLLDPTSPAVVGVYAMRPIARG